MTQETNAAKEVEDYRSDELRVVKLTHHYSRLKDTFYGVQTSLSSEDLQLACAYIQLLRDELPLFSLNDDVIGEPEGAYLLEKLYGAQRLEDRLPHEIDEVLDFHENWETVASSISSKDYATVFSRIARPGARLAIVNVLLDEARDALRKCEVCEDDKIDEKREELKQLEYIAAGGGVPIEWELVTISNSLYTKTLVASDKPDFPE